MNINEKISHFLIMVNYVLRISVHCFLWFPRGGRLASSKNLKGVQSSSTRKAAPSAQLAIGCVNFFKSYSSEIRGFLLDTMTYQKWFARSFHQTNAFYFLKNYR